jgi:spermidine synthase
VGLRVVQHRDGARLVDGECVISEMRAEPGPTHCLFDALACTIPALSPGSRVLMLGFAGGGVMAPLRATGWWGPIEAVDLDLDGEKVFRNMAGRWAGDVRVHQDDALRWLNRRPDERFDLIMEDLSVRTQDLITKPAVCYTELPREIQRHLTPHGIVVINALPVAGKTWKRLLQELAAPYARAVLVTFEQWENRLVIAGPRLWEPRAVSKRLRASLAQLGSRQRRRMSIRALHRD